MGLAHLFPFRAGGQEANNRLGDFYSTRDDGRVVDELVSAEFEEEEGGDEGGNVERDDVSVGHLWEDEWMRMPHGVLLSIECLRKSIEWWYQRIEIEHVLTFLDHRTIVEG